MMIYGLWLSLALTILALSFQAFANISNYGAYISGKSLRRASHPTRVAEVTCQVESQVSRALAYGQTSIFFLILAAFWGFGAGIPFVVASGKNAAAIYTINHFEKTSLTYILCFASLVTVLIVTNEFRMLRERLRRNDETVECRISAY